MPEIPLVTIVVISKDRNWWLENHSIPSVLNQSYQNIEILLVDDGTANVTKILPKFDNPPRIRCLKTKRVGSGTGAARNVGLLNSKGKYIGFLDDDDQLLRNHVSTLVSFLEDNPKYKAAYTDAYRIYYDSNGDGTYRRNPGDEVPHSNDFDRTELFRRNLMPGNCVMILKPHPMLLHDETLPSHEDWLFWWTLSKKYEFFHIKKTTCEVAWRNDGSHVTTAGDGKMAEGCRMAHKKIRYVR
tara:strand:+ start:494 stop:1219 length:726 start_codon:yes stop_codon:yes gene_type:complete